MFSSVAGDRGRKPVAIYGSSKGGLSIYLEALDHKWHSAGLTVTCVKPGFVKTGMTTGLKPPPFAGEPEQVAIEVVRAMDRKKPVVYTPGMWALIMWVIRMLPRFVMRKIGFRAVVPTRAPRYSCAMQRVLILGATSAIAGEVAEIYAKRGDHLCLVGRNREKLDSVVSRCAEAFAGAKVTSQQADFAKLEDNEALVERAFSELGGVDTVLIAHGDLGDQLATERTFDEAERTLRSNLLSAVALLIPIANRMEASRGGRIGVITSVAGERGRPRNYTYGTAKGALNVYLQGLRSRLYESG